MQLVTKKFLMFGIGGLALTKWDTSDDVMSGS